LTRHAPERIAFAVAAALLALVGARPARAAVGSTDYVVTATNGLYEPPPSAAVPVGISNNAGVNGKRVDFPFPFQFFGRLYDHVFATTYGYSRFGSDAAVYSFPVDPSTLGVGSPADGVCAPAWDYVVVPGTGNAVKWTAGVAPFRRLIVSYENVILNVNSSAKLTFQTKYFESTGRIEFAYKTTSTNWSGAQYAVAIDAFGDDPRWTAPVNTNTNNTGRPANDYRFEPRTVLLSGRVLYDRLTPSASGLSTTPTPAPASGLRIEVRNADGTTNYLSATDDLGYFALRTGVGPSAGADVYVHAQGAGCVVKAPGAADAANWRAFTGVTFLADVDFGTRSIDVGSDPNAVFREPASIASAIQRVYDYAAPKVTQTIPVLAVTYDAASTTAATAYSVGATASASTMVVAGPATANPDTWDDAVIQRTYGRHVLASIAQPPAPGSFAYDDRLDVVTDPVNAFAAGFGCYLHAVVEGRSLLVDTTSQSAAVTFDLESPTLTSPRGAAVAGWVAAALYDLVDPANESWDWTDGTTGNSARPLIFADLIAVVPDSNQLFRTWGGTGAGVLAVSRNFTFHGIIPDDAFEPNDQASESQAIGTVLLRRDALTLNAGNEDWFSFDAPAGILDLVAQAAFPRATYVTTVELQILTPAGAVVGGVVDSGTDVPTLEVGAVPAGSYRLRVRSVSGDTVPSYVVQIYDHLHVDATPLKSWTVGFPYEQTIPVTNGYPPYAFTVAFGRSPPGIQFDAAAGRASGTPAEPGTYDFTLVVQDAGNPAHSDSVVEHVVIAPPLHIDLGEFVGLPLGRPVDTTRAHVGGTAPLTVTVTAGAAPSGVALASDDLRFTGEATVPGSTAISISAVDVAGSESSTSTTCVVCVPAPAPKTPVDLHAHERAVGFFYDAVAGSTATVAVTNAPKVESKRALSIVVLGPDGSPVTGGKMRPGKGRAAAVNAPAPLTGRYFAVVTADDGEDEPLLGTVTVKPPTKTVGTLAAVQPGTTFEISFGALAGARLSLTARPERKSHASLSIVALVDPSGGIVSVDGAAKTKGTTASLATELSKSGTWTARVAATGGQPGKVTYVVKVVEPKGAKFSAD